MTQGAGLPSSRFPLGTACHRFAERSLHPRRAIQSEGFERTDPNGMGGRAILLSPLQAAEEETAMGRGKTAKADPEARLCVSKDKGRNDQREFLERRRSSRPAPSRPAVESSAVGSGTAETSAPDNWKL